MLYIEDNISQIKKTTNMYSVTYVSPRLKIIPKQHGKPQTCKQSLMFSASYQGFS